MTQNGIEYNLKVSPFISDIELINETKITLYFSSQFNKNKFDKLIESRTEDFINYLNKFVKIDLGELQNKIASIVRLYSQIEKRGFYIILNNEVYEWAKTITLNGVNLIITDCAD